MGHDNAFAIYKELIDYTHAVTQPLACGIIVYYSDYIEREDVWGRAKKERQEGIGLGERMLNAFKNAFDDGYERVVIIGTDCFEIKQPIIESAFQQLHSHEIVVGPALDGGYYLLAMKRLYPELFQNISWGSDTVFAETIAACSDLGLDHFLLPVLNDVDEEKDLTQRNLIV